jgi:hypothetical protein
MGERSGIKFPAINSPGQVSVNHARGFSGGRVGVGLWGCGWVLEPWASSDFLGESWENLEPVAKFWESPAGNSKEFRNFRIIRRQRSWVHQYDPRRELVTRLMRHDPRPTPPVRLTTPFARLRPMRLCRTLYVYNSHNKSIEFWGSS